MRDVICVAHLDCGRRFRFIALGLWQRSYGNLAIQDQPALHIPLGTQDHGNVNSYTNLIADRG
jgi:hypothetical protein